MKHVKPAFPFMKNDFTIRDPFIVADAQTKQYFLFGTTDDNPWFGPGQGFLVRSSPDLTHWSRAKWAFRASPALAGTANFWAPEVHFYQGRWYLIASMKQKEKCRGVYIMVSDKVDGPYQLLQNQPVTPRDWECLDGTLYVDEKKRPWLIFSHEWVQVQNGQICGALLRENLAGMAEEPVVLFRAADAPWVVASTGDVVKKAGENYVTDGPFVFHDTDGTLKMLWSSFGTDGYAMGLAASTSGKVEGPWRQEPRALYAKDGGHGMLFMTAGGKNCIAIHSPNVCGKERLLIMEYKAPQQ